MEGTELVVYGIRYIIELVTWLIQHTIELVILDTLLDTRAILLNG